MKCKEEKTKRKKIQKIEPSSPFTKRMTGEKKTPKLIKKKRKRKIKCNYKTKLNSSGKPFCQIKKKKIFVFAKNWRKCEIKNLYRMKKTDKKSKNER